MRIITKTVWTLSLVSLFTDIASEMLYPVMPVYLRTINFSILAIGILEGLAEATAGLSKGYFGKRSDQTGKRLPFVQWGYFISALSKPAMAAFTWAWWVFGVRTTDRMGKGIRTGARDAMLSEAATPKTKATVFGFHRAMDTLGAVTGPLLALLFLYYYPGRYQLMFLLAFIPGIVAIGFTFFLKDKPSPPKQSVPKTPFLGFLTFFRSAPPAYRRLIAGLLVFALFNSSDVFLLLKIRESGFSDTATIGVYVFYNLVYALLSYPLGILADKAGLKKVFMAGLFVFALVYLLMAFGGSIYVYLAAFILYGGYAAATEGVAKAWITNIASKADTATAIGTYTAFQSVCALMASSLTGFIWLQWGAKAAFITSAAAALTVTGYLMLNRFTIAKKDSGSFHDR